jgi:hypothetical protein
MLEIRVHNAEKLGIRVPPAMYHGSRQSLLVVAN